MKRSSIRHCFLVAILISTILIVLFGVIMMKLTDVGFFDDNTSTTTVSLEENEVQEIETIGDEEEQILEGETIADEGNQEPEVEIIVDNAPSITLVGDEIVTVDSINNYVEPGFSAEDDIDGNLTDSVQTEVIQENNYNYQVEYSVTDSAGNITTKTRDVRVIIGVVCLTFDDGPSTEITPQVLDILEKNNVNATFFITGYSEDKEEIVRRIDEEGNVIGFHGYTHDYDKIYQDIDSLMENFYELEEQVLETIGKDSKILRFPGGTSNTISEHYCSGIMTAAVQRVTAEGYLYVDWNVDSNDAGSDANNSDAIYANVVQGLKPGRTNVILMHDRKEKQATVDALQRIIDYCINNGYDIQVLTHDTPVGSSQHNPSN